jgi:hypothetical protein
VACGVAVMLAALAATAARAAEEGATNLPLKRVVLFSAGVGFFEHAGVVQDNAKVEMKFNVRDINDLLKSMVVQDLDGGQVSTVNYGSKDPITKTLKTFAVDLTANPTLAQLLQQVRGEKVEIEAPAKFSGVILGVETRKKQIGEHQFIDIDVLNLVTDEGLRAVPLETVSRIKLANPQLDSELNKALALLASAHATDKKAVSLSFLGQGKRKVRVGYIQETPVWKTTYRLVISDEKPLLQGWAIVENTSEQDWSNVSLSLVSGRPISFLMDLYQPLYVPRPQVELELYASLRPQTYGQDMAAKERQFAAAKEPPPPPAAAAPGLAMRRAAPADPRARQLAERAAAGPAQAGERLEKDAADEDWGLRRGVQSVAQAADVGSLFQYAIRTPVSLPRQQSAMLPIVDADVKAAKVSIYNPRVLAKHPLTGLKFTNSTDLHLMQGPITVFDDKVYAGDAKIDDMPPGSTRLVSYAVDLDTEVAPQSKGRPDQLLTVKLLKGTMFISRKFTRGTEYTIKNSGKKAKTVLIEYPIDPTWTLVTPKEPAEKTRDLYRFAVQAKPGDPAALMVEEERIEPQQVALSNIDDNTIQIYLSSKVVSDKVKAALQEVIKRKHALAQVVARKQQLEQRIREIDQDQARIRQNMAQLDRASDVYKNYVKKFSDQEKEIEKTREQIAAQVDQENGLRKSLDEYLMGLDLQ